MKLSEITTDKTKYNVNTRDLLTNLKKDIIAFEEYNGTLPPKKLAQYIILMYDPESPLRREVGDYMQRKAKCAELVDFKKEKGRWVAEVDDMLVGKDQDANKLIAAYIAHLAMPEYGELIVLLEIQRHKTIEAFSGNITDNTHKTLAAVTENISKITKHLFGSGETDEIQVARRSLYAQANIDKPPMPEDMVDKLSDGGLPEDCNPYGEDYVVKEPHFLDDQEPEH